MSNQANQMKVVLDYLNSITNADPAALHSLVCNRVPCNDLLVDHPHVTVDRAPVMEECFTVGLLGVVNGLLTSLGLRRVCGEWNEFSDGGSTKNTFVGFRIAPDSLQPKPVHPFVVIAIPHQGRPVVWRDCEPPIKEDGDLLVKGDHDLNSCLPFETEDDIQAAWAYKGHQEDGVRMVAHKAIYGE